ncbi:MULTISPECIES: hypothetical protein [Pirellulaceae]|uniref:hypothetical protein n=1 Tax=Pirellulaceae TaxID=2691357 RepID=UPI0011AFFAA4|nr:MULTISPECIES: hypothetical protein [Pirellulaceae]
MAKKVQTLTTTGKTILRHTFGLIVLESMVMTRNVIPVPEIVRYERVRVVCHALYGRSQPWC